MAHVPGLAELLDGLPNISGSEPVIAAAIGAGAARPGAGLLPGQSDFARVRSAAAVALHMHQPLVPAGGGNLRTARIIGNLQYMVEHPWMGEHSNAPVIHACYKRLGEIVPALVDEGCTPRVMLDYSGTLLYGLRQMGYDDVFESLTRLTCDPAYRDAVEWLGCAWGHPVAPSTPARDYGLHVRAWQHHFAATFGLEALARVRGFSPAEMALPNHPDQAHAFVRTLRDCGYQWVLVQEDTVESPDGGRLRCPHVPHRLVCRNGEGQETSIVAVVKTGGSNARAVGEMRSFEESRGLSREHVKGTAVPPLVAQIADGENETTMMHGFPAAYARAVRAASQSDTPLMNVSEYLAGLAAAGVTEEALPPAQPAFQHGIWRRFAPDDGPERLAHVIGTLQHDDPEFRMEGGSWTNHISWVRGYEPLVDAIEQVSARFTDKVLERGVSTAEPRFRHALFHLLACETSCYRYWGQGIWVDWGREMCRRTTEILEREF